MAVDTWAKLRNEFRRRAISRKSENRRNVAVKVARDSSGASLYLIDRIVPPKKASGVSVTVVTSV
jgi:hypothetical protein